MTALRHDPPAQLLDELLDMKARGLDFEHAWRVAFKRIVWPDDKLRRNEWRQALESTKDAWSDAYRDTGTVIEIERLVGMMAA